jgi:cell division protein FtsB
MRNVRRKQVAEDRKKKGIIYLTFGILLFVYLTVNMTVGDNGLLKYIQLKSIHTKLMAETLAIQSQNDAARNQIEALKQEPAMIEELAREYGLTKKGELIFKFSK